MARHIVQSMDRLGDSARRVVERAQAEARDLDHPHLGTEHLLLGLLTVESPARDALIGAGATADATRAKVEESVGKRSPAQLGDPQFSARARRAVDRASRLSLNRRDPQVDPEHLLLGVLDVEGRAGQVLRGLGVDVVALRVAAELPKANLSADAALVATPGGLGPPLHCASCGAGIDEPGLAYRIVAAEDEEGRRREFAVASCAACGAVLGVSLA